MASGTTQSKRPHGIMRWFLRLPIWLYRVRLGWLLGPRFIMFQHTGRKSGQARYTVVEVVRHDLATDTYTIASGWGEKADWFRNIQKTPEVLLYTGRRRFPALAHRLSIPDATHALVEYTNRHPTAFRNLSAMMIGRKLSGSEEDCRTLAQSVPLVALVPQQTPDE